MLLLLSRVFLAGFKLAHVKASMSELAGRQCHASVLLRLSRADSIANVSPEPKANPWKQNHITNPPSDAKYVVEKRSKVASTISKGAGRRHDDH